MEQDKEKPQADPARPMENDLFNLSGGDSPRTDSGEHPVNPQNPSPESERLPPVPEIPREPEFKVNPEDHPAVHMLNPTAPDSAAADSPAFNGRENRLVVLRSGDGATLGNLLSEARAAAGFSIETVSRESRIRHDFIEALEADRLDDLPNLVFLRAYVRELIRFYNLDPASAARIEGLMEDFRPAPEVPEKLVEDIGRGGQISETETRRIRLILIYGSVILLLLVSLVVTSVLAVSIRNKRIEAKRLQQEDKPFDTSRLESLIPPQLPQPQMLRVPASSARETKPAARKP